MSLTRYLLTLRDHTVPLNTDNQKSLCSPGAEEQRGSWRDMASLEVSEERNKENLPAFVISETIYFGTEKST